MPQDGSGYRRERDDLLARIVAALESDPRIVAAWLAGSLGRDTSDEFSDLDLWIVVEDDRIRDIAAEPDGFVHSIVPTVMEIHAPAIAPPGGAFLLTWIDGEFGPQEVDWYWQPETGTTRHGRTRLLFERRPIAIEPPAERLSPADLDRAIDAAVRDSLQMTFSAAKRAGRSDAWTAAAQLAHLATCIGKVERLVEHGTAADFDDRARAPLPAAIPVTVEARLAWIGESLQRLEKLLAASSPITLNNLKDAMKSVERWVGAIGEVQGQSDNRRVPPGG